MRAASAQGVDLVVGDITGTTNYVLAGTPKAYSLAVILCNLGATPASFDGTTAAHPVVTQNLYRLYNGRFQQLGQAWAQHLSSATQEAFCATCSPVPGFQALGAGCSSPDSAAIMGQQTTFGAKSEVNATTGAVRWPRVNQGDPSTTTAAAFKRLQVPQNEFPVGGLYFVSAMVISAEDGGSGHAANNESYRRVSVGFINSGLPLAVQGSTQRGTPAIQAWKDHGLGINVPDPAIVLTPVDVPGDGRYWVGVKATLLGGGLWHYEYAVQNLTSDRSGASFSVPLLPAASVSNAGFYATPYHSGEVFSNQTWTVTIAGAAITWSCPETFSQNPDANALRWDTINNFWFDAALPPSSGTATIGLFKPGTSGAAGSVLVATAVPGPACGTADYNNDGDTGTDADIEAFFRCLSGTCCAACPSDADFNGDGDVGTDADIEAFFRVLAGGNC